MPKFKALSDGYVERKLIKKGKTFDYSGVPGRWMEPVDEAAKKVWAAWAKEKGVKMPGEKVRPERPAKDDPSKHTTKPNSKSGDEK